MDLRCGWDEMCYLSGHQRVFCPARPQGSDTETAPWLVFERFSAYCPAVSLFPEGLTYLSFKDRRQYAFNKVEAPNKYQIVHTYCWNGMLGVSVSPNNTTIIHYVSIKEWRPNIKEQTEMQMTAELDNFRIFYLQEEGQLTNIASFTL